LRAHGRQVVFIKKHQESAEHVIMKALLWALYLPTYPDMRVEVRIGDRYKPDVVALDHQGQPRFWGESGHVGADKLQSLLRRYPQTHFAFARWAVRLEPFAEIVYAALGGRLPGAPIDLLAFPDESVERFIADNGSIAITHEDLNWLRITP
jgi:hypothetical protein